MTRGCYWWPFTWLIIWVSKMPIYGIGINQVPHHCNKIYAVDALWIRLKFNLGKKCR